MSLRQIVSKATLQNLEYWSNIEETMGKKASYDGKTPCLPVRTYPWMNPILWLRQRETKDWINPKKKGEKIAPWRVCSDNISMTLPPLWAEIGSYWKLREVTSKTASNWASKSIRHSESLNLIRKWVTLFDDSSSGEKILKIEGFFLMTSTKYNPIARKGLSPQ